MRKFLWIFWSIGILALIGTSIVLITKTNFFTINGFEQALSGYLTVSSITLGFFATSISIIATIMNTPLVKDILSDKDYTKQFKYILIVTIVSGVFSILFTIFFQVSIQGEAGQAASKYDFSINIQGIISAIWFLVVTTYFLYLSLFLYVVVFMLFESGKEQVITNDENVTEVKVTKNPFKEKKEGRIL